MVNPRHQKKNLNKIKNKRKKEALQRAFDIMEEHFPEDTKSKVTNLDVMSFVKQLNPILQEYAHKVVPKNGGPQNDTLHITRLQVKNQLVMEILQELAKYYPEQVVKYNWEVIKNLRERIDINKP